MTIKVALYCRVSTTDQYPENQVRVLTDLAEKNGAEIVATFIDKGCPTSACMRQIGGLD